MSRDRDRARVALEFLGEWFQKGIEPEAVAFSLVQIDPAILPIEHASQIDAALREASGYARPGPITTADGMAWLRQVLEEGLEHKAQFAEIDAAVGDAAAEDWPHGPSSVEEFRAERGRWAARRMDHYDCLDVGKGCAPVTRLFGNLNIGDLKLTSMQVGGYLHPTDLSSVIDHWYARTTAVGDDRVLLEQWAEGASVILNIGDHPVWVKPLAVLLRERPWVPPARRGEVLTPEEIAQFEVARAEGAEPVLVPVRQHMDVQFILPTGPDMVAPVNARIWVHVEGLTLQEIQ